ncbi:FG-GAP-like repeat-containing protein, partial [Nevskia ramosa]|uniref:FG-GAP-like repeat-containing protein n=1 Tax=Nevskia ramosa TaxID=64002 RepID=UPI002357F5A8
MKTIVRYGLRELTSRMIRSLAFSLLIPLCAQAVDPQISIDDAQVVEGNSPPVDMLFTVRREGGGDLGKTIRSSYTVSPSGANPATPGVDYAVPPAKASVTIAAGQMSGVLRLPVLPDTANEPDETLQVQLGTARAFMSGANFFTAPTFPAGVSPVAIASADFNGDGDRDIVVANFNNQSPVPGSVSILLGNGAGGFGAPVEYPVRGFAASVVVADFNGDGRLDLATALLNGAGAQVAILRGEAGGSFAEPAYYPGGTESGDSRYAASLFAADFNGDGKLDLAMSNGDILILLGDGQGGFSVGGQYVAEYPSSANSMTIGDFNGDGHVDVAATNTNTANISILLGDGAGGLAAPVNYRIRDGFNSSIAASDFDRDGKLDLAVVDQTQNTATTLRGDGAGAFTELPASHLVGNYPSSVIAGDFDGDGLPDLAVAAQFGNVISFLRGDGAGGFAESVDYQVGGFPPAVTAADFNGDGHLDLAAPNAAGVSILLGENAGGFLAPASYRVGGDPVAVAVITGSDGHPGLVTANASVTNLSLLPNLGTGSFWAATSLGLPSNPTSLAVADFDGDG